FFPSISKDIVKVLIESAHKNGVMLVVHVDNLISAKEVISLGANGIVHSFMDEVADDELINMMKANNAFMIPTLSVEASVARLSNSTQLLENPEIIDYISRQQKQQLKAVFPDFKIPASSFQKALDSVKLLSQAGITILAGSDAPNPGTTHGISIHGELAFLAQAGLTNQQVIYSATAAAREYFPIGLRGTLKVGAMASMILIDGNVFDDINYSVNINRIWKNGVQFKRSIVIDQDTSNQDQVFSTGLISDFNSSIKQTNMGTAIVPTSDQYAGGKSVVELTHLQRNSQQDKYLHVKGEIKKGYMFQWSGMSYIPGVDQGHGVNLSHIKTLTFDAKAGQNTDRFSVLLFQQGNFQPSTQEIRLSDQWQTYQIELANFNNVDLAEISNISIVVTRKLGKFEFMLDNLKFE
ncbi:MAG: amidohydrolase family protein, partial [Alcanivoracaceae bacterium]|nr:amidohydrolase family protein [Alcanivoracaceae bacterium]